MGSQIQVSTIQSSETVKTTEKIETDGHLFESMLNQQQSDKSDGEQDSLTAFSKKEDKEAEGLIEDKRLSEKTEENLMPMIPPFVMEMLQQETTIATSLGIDKEMVPTLIEKNLSNVALTPKEKAVIDQLLAQIETEKKIELEPMETVSKLSHLGEKIEHPVFYQKNVWDAVHGQAATIAKTTEQMNDSTLSERAIVALSELDEMMTSVVMNASPETKGPELSTYLNQLNRKPLVEEPVIPEIPEEKVSNEETLKTTLNTITLTEENNANKQVLQANQLTSKIEQPEQSTEMKTFNVNEVIRSTTNSFTSTETVEIPQAQPVIAKEELDVIRTMITEKIQQPGKPDTMKSTVQLTPETLGKMTVEVEMVDKQLVGRMVVATEEAKTMVEKQFKAQALLQPSQLLKLDKIEVTVQQVQQSFNAGFNFSEQQQSAFSEHPKPKKGYATDKEVEADIVEGTDKPATVPGSLNVMA
ncbi:flagellar hook-length control protein FliK [Marinilactibacillus kalidii]|uniref:flagellar hook-length control protein FliK n=1 Tax=Marinilactibacillus kalidii TaxID=2820274 RepID=UPI001ABEE6DD|nr:flagellar hook-length control protein FliK [Marinilactibacillus kalidii]